MKGAPVTYAIGSKQYLAVQASGRHLHPVKYDNLQDSSYLFVFALLLRIPQSVRVCPELIGTGQTNTILERVNGLEQLGSVLTD